MPRPASLWRRSSIEMLGWNVAPGWDLNQVKNCWDWFEKSSIMSLLDLRVGRDFWGEIIACDERSVWGI